MIKERRICFSRIGIKIVVIVKCQNIYIGISRITRHILRLGLQRSVWRIHIKHIVHAFGFQIISGICIQTLITFRRVSSSPPEPSAGILMQWTEDDRDILLFQCIGIECNRIKICLKYLILLSTRQNLL